MALFISASFDLFIELIPVVVYCCTKKTRSIFYFVVEPEHLSFVMYICIYIYIKAERHVLGLLCSYQNPSELVVARNKSYFLQSATLNEDMRS